MEVPSEFTQESTNGNFLIIAALYVHATHLGKPETTGLKRFPDLNKIDICHLAHALI